MEIITSFLSTFWYVIPILVLVGILKSAWFKGKLGEFIVNLSAKFLLDKKTYHLIKDVTLPTEDGSTQIDHIIVSVFGVFVVETKNIKGWIFGGEKQRQWTQKIYKHSSKFQNPLHQNYKHVRTLQVLLSLNDDQMYSLVVFVGDSTFKTDMPSNVTEGGGYIRYIKSKQVQVLAHEQVSEVIDKIESGRLVQSFKTNREHVKHLKVVAADKQNSESCPKCGNAMTMREAKKGQNTGQKFWGCSTYPKCRGTVAINAI
jgi:restriction system protein